jgi:mono/diheme cytochrome c family protein
MHPQRPLTREHLLQATRTMRMCLIAVLTWRSCARPPDMSSLLDAIAIYERSLLTPDSRFDHWLTGDKTALAPEEQQGYALFQSLGCISCHQGVNIGGNLFERRGIFHPLASGPAILRVPSLRNVAVMAPTVVRMTLQEAVRRMAWAQLDQKLDDRQIEQIVAFLKTLTGNFQGVPVRTPPPWNRRRRSVRAGSRRGADLGVNAHVQLIYNLRRGHERGQSRHHRRAGRVCRIVIEPPQFTDDPLRREYDRPSSGLFHRHQRTATGLRASAQNRQKAEGW